jgi:hypothetical protein
MDCISSKKKNSTNKFYLGCSQMRRAAQTLAGMIANKL